MARKQIKGSEQINASGTPDNTKFLRGDDTWATPAGGSGGAWPPFTQILAPTITLPVLGGFTWGNQGTATATTTTAGAILVSDADAASNLRHLYKAPPGSGAWSFQVGFLMGPWYSNLQSGIAMRESSSGKLIVFQMQINGGLVQIFLTKLTNYTTFSANYWNSPSNIGWASALVWLKVAYDGSTNYTWSISLDGQNWTQWGIARAANDFFTTKADQVGFFLTSDTAAQIQSSLWFHAVGP